MPATTTIGIPYPVSTDNNNVPGDMQSLATWLDPVIEGSYTQTEINAFSAMQKWAGRRVYNSTRGCHQWTDGSSWYDEQAVAINTKSTTYTLVLADANSKLIQMTNTSAATLLVPTNANVAFPIGSVVTLVQWGTAQVTITGESGVTLRFTPGNKTRTQYSTACLVKMGTDEWLLSGDLTA